MAATASNRNTTVRNGLFITFPVEENTKINGGSIVATNAAGFGVPASADATLIVWGKCVTAVDNTGGADGDKSVTVELSAGFKDFLYAINSTSIQADDVGKACYVVDDQTVDISSSTNTRPKAGTVMGVTSTGVFVRFDR